MQPQPMLAASLIERFLRAGDTSRAAPAYYLSRSEHGRSMLTYVKKEDLAVVQQHCTAYPAFQQNLKAWRRDTATLQQRRKSIVAGPVPVKTFLALFFHFPARTSTGRVQS